MLSDSDKQQLDESGYLLFPDFMRGSLLGELRERVDELFAREGEAAGREFRQEPNAQRLANVVDKGEVFERVIVTPEILDAMAYVLGPRFKLSSLNVRSANPLSDCAQPLHADSGAIADEQGYWVCNSIWMLDDFTPRNGATRVIPGSHRWRRLPPLEHYGPWPGERLLLGRAGSVAIVNSHAWHGATANRTAAPRRAMHAYYTRYDKPQQQYQKRLLSEPVQRRLGREARRILALDDPLNDELSSTGSGASGFLK